MELIVERPPRSYWLQVIQDVAEFRSPFGGTPYPCLLWDARGGWSVEEFSHLSTPLLASGLRYAVCGGIECERWHDAIDEAFIDLDLKNEAYESRFVMTSWHRDEPPDEVAFFLVENTNFDAHDFSQFLVLQLGGDAQMTTRLCEAVRDQA